MLCIYHQPIHYLVSSPVALESSMKITFFPWEQKWTVPKKTEDLVIENGCGEPCGKVAYISLIFTADTGAR